METVADREVAAPCSSVADAEGKDPVRSALSHLEDRQVSACTCVVAEQGVGTRGAQEPLDLGMSPLANPALMRR